MRLCRHWRRRYDKRYYNLTILSGKECVTQIGSKSKAGGNAALPDLTVFIQQYSGIRDDDVVSDPCYQDIKSTVFFYCKRVKTGHHAFDDHGVVQLISDEGWSSVVPCMDFHDHRRRSQDSGIYGNPADLSDHWNVSHDTDHDAKPADRWT